MILKIALYSSDPFFRLIASGFGVMYIFQIFLTIGGGTKFIPLTGVTLPLVSYGGSSVMTTLILFPSCRESGSGNRTNGKRRPQTQKGV